jgi:4-amino-4-deoxy-L-arabinose transferase
MFAGNRPCQPTEAIMNTTVIGKLSLPKGLALILIAAYVVIYLLPLGVRPMLTPDETRYLEISREMVASGDWVSPRFNGVRYFEKPVAGYWLNSASIALFGENEFALRLPSALAAGLTALMVFFLTLSFASRFSAYLAAGIYSTTILVAGTGTFAVLDSFLAFFLTGSLASYYLALRESERSRRQIFLAVCGAFCAGAFLTKGFLALAIPVIVVGPYLLVRRQFRDIFTTPWIPILVAALLVAPWAILIHIREPDFWNYFFWVEHVQRFLGDNAQHLQPPWFFFVYGPLVALPWSVLLPAAIIGLMREPHDRPFLTYLVAWFAMPFLFFSASNGKLMTYILPCFAPLSILLAIGLERYLASGRRTAFTVGSGLLAVGFAFLIVLAVAAQRGAFDQEFFPPAEYFTLWGLVGIFVAGLAAALFAMTSRSPGRRIIATAAAGITLFAPLQLLLLPQWFIDTKAPAAYLAEEMPISDDTILVSGSSLFGAVAASFKRDDVYVFQPGEIGYGLSYPESRHRLLDAAGLASLRSTDGPPHDIVIVCQDHFEQLLPAALIEGAERKQRGDVIMLRVRSE